MLEMLSDALAPGTDRSTPAKRAGEARPNQRPARIKRGVYAKDQAYEKAAEDHVANSGGSNKRVRSGQLAGGKSVSTRVEEQPPSKRTGGLSIQSSVNIQGALLGAFTKKAPRATKPCPAGKAAGERQNVVQPVAALAPPTMLPPPVSAASTALPGAISQICVVNPSFLSDVYPAVLQKDLDQFHEDLVDMFANGGTAPSPALPSTAPLPSRPVRAGKLLDSALHLEVRTCIAESTAEPACIAKKLPVGQSIVVVIKRQVDILLDTEHDAPIIDRSHHHIVRACKCSNPAKQ